MSDAHQPNLIGIDTDNADPPQPPRPNASTLIEPSDDYQSSSTRYSPSDPYLNSVPSNESLPAYQSFSGDVTTRVVSNSSASDDYLYNSTNSRTNDDVGFTSYRPRKKGLAGAFSNIKSKLGFKSQYAGMDLPLTEQGAAMRERESYRDDSDDDKDKEEFDMRKLFNKIIRKKEIDPATLGPRVVHLNNTTANSALGYKDNHISTTKYNIATFLPKFLFEQFSKYANLFFLFTSCIQQIPNISPTNRFTTILTLALVLIVSAVKELAEDLKRNAADKELNNSKALVLVGGEFQEKLWIKVAVGDIIKVCSEQPIPADIILLASSEPDGLCYIETANLDGETNLKIKQACPDTSELISPSDLGRISGTLLSEQPNSSLYTYEATLEIEDSGNGMRKIPLSPEQLLLRGATLRNTQWVHGLVVFTGHETKLMRNATATPIKRTAVEHMLNLQIIYLVIILIVLSIISSTGNLIKNRVDGRFFGYLMLQGQSSVKEFFLDILTYWILYSNLVPISLFVTVEIVKFYQAYLISSDLDMYYKESDTPAVCRTSSLVEELGQIEYIFSDKTGTLTRNIMEFKCCSIAGHVYALDVPEDRRITEVDGVEVGYHDFDTLRSRMSDHESKVYILEFFTLLAACHTVIPEVKPNGQIKYQAASPDEGALVEGAALLGYKFTVRRPKCISIDIRGQSYDYELLNICEFNSTRKRMSAIFRCPDKKIRLYCKGADTVIYERLTPESSFKNETTTHLEDFASEGLRTLCLATRVIPDAEYNEWAAIFENASTTLTNRSEALDKAAELIEKDMYLLGATAIEDKLQEGVPETIYTLQNAGIKIWVLTGDRQETAINIGMSCKLLSEEMSLLTINKSNYEETQVCIDEYLDQIRGSQDPEVLGLVIDGKSLGFALDKRLEKRFLNLAVQCKAVICCRVSPLQKALVVKLVKRHKKALLLAIGDGANDVSMIQAAHVGVGISGMEGMQAAQSADVAIGQFRYLRKLLLVHGAWSYHRLSKAILYSFYKNIVLHMTQFWYTFESGFSGQSIIESWTITFYNVFFTSLPPFVIGIFDQYLSAKMLDRYPQLYSLGRNKAFFNSRHFWEWVINGFFQSAILYVGVTNGYKFSNSLPTGLIADNWTMGTALYTVCIFTALGKAGLIINQWNKFAVIAIPGSFLLWIAFFPAYATVAPKINVSPEYLGILSHLYPTAVFWALVLVMPVMALFRDFAYKYYKRMYRPLIYHHVQEIQKYNIADYRPRMEQFQKTIRKVRQVQRMRKQHGFAFSQADEGQSRIIAAYDTTMARGQYGEMKSLHHHNTITVRD